MNDFPFPAVHMIWHLQDGVVLSGHMLNTSSPSRHSFPAMQQFGEGERGEKKIYVCIN